MSFQKAAILDRAKGALLGTAVADALGAGYEFQPPLADDVPVKFKAGSFGIGEYTDDTAQLIAVARASAKGDILLNLDLVAKEFRAWYDSNPKTSVYKLEEYLPIPTGARHHCWSLLWHI